MPASVHRLLAKSPICHKLNAVRVPKVCTFTGLSPPSIMYRPNSCGSLCQAAINERLRFYLKTFAQFVVINVNALADALLPGLTDNHDHLTTRIMRLIFA